MAAQDVGPLALLPDLPLALRVAVPLLRHQALRRRARRVALLARRRGGEEDVHHPQRGAVVRALARRHPQTRARSLPGRCERRALGGCDRAPGGPADARPDQDGESGRGCSGGVPADGVEGRE